MFISFWNPIKAIGDTIVSFFFGVLLTLDALIYSLISWVYQIILVLCNADILSNNFEIDALVGRIYIILGVVILFLVAYSLLKSMVNPDEAMKGKKSPVTIVKDVIISVVLIAIVPTIFSFAMEFQQALLTRNTLGSIILGTSSNISGEEVSSSELIENGGMIIATGVLEAFLHPNYSACQEVSGEAKKEYPSGYNCDNVTIESYEPGVGNVKVPFREFWKNMQENNNIFAIVELNNDALGDGKVTYYWIISTVAGVFVLFVLIQYCFDIAVRAVKLAVYELMAPIPILARIMPNEQANKVFSNWLKATISTFVEVFIRLAILFFAVLIIKIVVQNFPSMLAPLFNGEGSWTVALFAQMFLILGIILFVKQAPEILKEITGLDGSKYNPIKSAMQTAALLGGGVTAAVRNWNDDKNPDGKKKNAFNRFRSALGGAGSAAYRSMWNRDNVKDPKSMAENASKSAENAIKAHNNRVARKLRYSQAGEGRFNDMKKSIHDWATGSFEAQQQLLDQVNAFMNDAKEVKTATEGFIRDKKYLFKFGTTEDFSHGGKTVTVDGDTTLSAMEAMIESLKSSGDLKDAVIADKIKNAMEKQIKTIGKDMVGVSQADPTTAAGQRTISTFNTQHMATENGRLLDITDKGGTAIAKTKSAYDLVQERYKTNGALDAVIKFQQPAPGSTTPNTLQTDNVSDLADRLEEQAAKIQSEIKVEQEKRKAKDKK